MKLKLLALILVLTIFSCGSGKPPKGILPKDQMISILVDQHLTEPLYMQRFSLGIPDSSAMNDLYLSVLKKHKVSPKEFVKSVYYYGKHPNQYIEIYNKVLDRLNAYKVKVEKENPAIKK